MKYAILILPFIFCSATIYVPDDYRTIQAAVNAASDYDTIIVKSGTYNENVVVWKELDLRSLSGAERTVVDGQQNGSCFYFSEFQEDSSLDGFTIQNGSGEMVSEDFCCGGGIYCPGATVTIKNNRIINNSTALGQFQHGGGVYIGYLWAPTDDDVNDYAAILHDNYIAHNESFWGGGVCIEFFYLQDWPSGYAEVLRNTFEDNKGGGCSAIYIYRAEGIADRNVIIDNENTYPYVPNPAIGVVNCRNTYYGADATFIVSNNAVCGNNGVGIGLYSCDIVYAVNNTVFENGHEAFRVSLPSGGAGDFDLVNNIAWSSKSIYGYTIVQRGDSHVFYDNNCIEDGEDGIDLQDDSTCTYGQNNIESDPNIMSGGYHINQNSPCRSAGTISYGYPPMLDIDGDYRILYVIDIGADEIW